MSISLVQKAEARTTSSSTAAATISASTGGNLLAVLINTSLSAGSDPATGITDNAGNTYIKADAVNLATLTSEIWYCPNCQAGATTVTVTVTTSAVAINIVVVEFSGVKTTSPLEAHNTLGTTEAPVSPSLSASANSLQLAVIYPANIDITSSQSPWTDIYDISNQGASTYYIAPSAGAYNATFNPTTSQSFTAVGASFLQASITPPTVQTTMFLAI
jgi:hypothetical protein